MSVEQRHAELERAVDRGDRLDVVAVPVELGHPHAAEALAGHLQALASKCCFLHQVAILSR
jgi:hypothetical protein